MIKLKSIFSTIYLVLIFMLLITFKTNIFVWLSFLFSTVIISVITIYHLYYEKNYSPFLSSYIVFNFLFFLAAPISQIGSFYGIDNPKFVTYFPYKENLVIYTNLLITLFNIIFITSYIYLKQRLYFNYEPKKEPVFKARTLPFLIFILSIISLSVVVISYGFIKEELIRPNWLISETSVASLLLWKKFLFFIPFATIALCFQYFNKENKKTSNYINIVLCLGLMLAVLFWFKNPLTEKRNALGPIYISLIYLFFPIFLNKNIKTLSFLFFSMIILFPLTAIITHTDATLSEIYRNPMILIIKMKGGGITDALGTLNYDAFANITTSINYVNEHSFSCGYQLLGGLFFFIPRSLWRSKPISSGQLIGEYLVDDFGFNFTNLSNSLVSESFLNFGLIGVLFFPLMLAYILIILSKWLKGSDYLKKIMAFYFAIHLIFFLRGDFTNGFSYYIGPLLAVVVFPKVIQFLIKEVNKAIIYGK